VPLRLVGVGAHEPENFMGMRASQCKTGECGRGKALIRRTWQRLAHQRDHNRRPLLALRFDAGFGN
jgi:hypothetical protein